MPIKKFPGEDEHSQSVRSDLEWHFDFAERLHFHYLTIEREEWIYKSTLPEVVLRVAHMIDLQMCRQFRSVVDECARAEAIGATIIARSLFESLLALLFVLRPQVFIQVSQETDKSTGLPKPGKFNAGRPPKGKRRNKANFLTRTLRAQLYGFHAMIRDTKMPQALREVGMTRLSKPYEKSADHDEVLKEANRIIGSQWVHILGKANHCSGLSIATIAEMLGRPTHRWHKTIYSLLSGSVHANSPTMLMLPNQDSTDAALSFFSSTEDTARVLESAIGVFLSGAVVQQLYVGFGPINDIALNGLKEEYKLNTAKASELAVS